MLTLISPDIVPELVGCYTSGHDWITIERLFISQSRANKLQLKVQLQTLGKGGITMSEYLLKKKSIFDALAHT
ncbi:hypothetical protein ACOSP7_013792 [Xanthoceras sorbifolium]